MTAEEYNQMAQRVEYIAQWCSDYIRTLDLLAASEQWSDVILEDILDAEYIG